MKINTSKLSKSVLPSLNSAKTSLSGMIDYASNVSAPSDFIYKSDIKSYADKFKNAKKSVTSLSIFVSQNISLIKSTEKHNKKLASAIRKGLIDSNQLLIKSTKGINKEKYYTYKSLGDKINTEHTLKLYQLDETYTYNKNHHNWNKKTLNCVSPLVVTLKENKVLDKDDKFYNGYNKKTGENKIINGDKLLSKGFTEVKSANGKTLKSLDKSGTLKKGDIIFYKGCSHTAIYDGEKIKDCGKTATDNENDDGGHYEHNSSFQNKDDYKYYNKIVYTVYRPPDENTIYFSGSKKDTVKPSQSKKGLATK